MTFYRKIWLAIYVLANLFAATVFFVTDQLDGDLIGYPLPSYTILAVATFAVVVSYLIWMGPVFNIFSSLKVDPLISSWGKSSIQYDERIVGIFVLLVQVLFFIFNFYEGLNVAGSREQSESPIRYFWILLAPDALFLVYYSLYRKSLFFAPNLIVYLVSNVTRGWLGMWVIVLFIEGAYRTHEGRLKWKKVLLLGGIFSLFLPILYQLKLAIRTSTGGTFDVGEIAQRVLSVMSSMDWWDSSFGSIWPALMRFQHLANVIGIMDQSTWISEALEKREFLYFLEEGLPQYVFRKIFEFPSIPDIHLQLLTFLIPEQLPVDAITNTHVGLVGWLWISPELFLLYFMYLLLISGVGVWVAKKAGGTPLQMDLIWFAWLGFLMNGWFAAYIEFVQALVVLMCVRVFATRVGWAGGGPIT